MNDIKDPGIAQNLIDVEEYIAQVERERDEARAEVAHVRSVLDGTNTRWEQAIAEVEGVRAELQNAISTGEEFAIEVERLRAALTDMTAQRNDWEARGAAPAALPVLPDVAEQVSLLWEWRTNRGTPFLAMQDDVPVMRELLAGKLLRDVVGFEWLGEALDAEVADTDTDTAPDTSRVTFGARHEGTGMVLLQHADLPREPWGVQVAETAEHHRSCVTDPSVLPRFRATHAALAEVREALNAAEAAGVDVDDDGCAIPGILKSKRQQGVDDIDAMCGIGANSPQWRAGVYLLREVQALVKQGLMQEDLNMRVPFEVRDHRTPVEAAVVVGGQYVVGKDPTFAGGERCVALEAGDVGVLSHVDWEGDARLVDESSEFIGYVHRRHLAPAPEPVDLPDTTTLAVAVAHTLESLEDGGLPDTFDGDATVTDQAAALLTELVRVAAVRADRLAKAGQPVLPDVGPVTRDGDRPYLWVDNCNLYADDAILAQAEQSNLVGLARIRAARTFLAAEAADTSSDDEPPVTVGSVVEKGGKRYALTGDADAKPWVNLTDGDGAEWVSAASLRAATVLFDAHRAARTSEERNA